MKFHIALLLGLLGTIAQHLLAQSFTTAEVARWQQQAKRVTIIRDQWGIPHIYGKTDADAVFGLLYAQCEDDFARVEANYIEKLGRSAEVNGPKALYDDLLHRLILDSAEARRDYLQAAPWLKKLCDAFADGINFFLATHPQVKPALLTRFEPWWPMLWTDGSIGAISTGGATEKQLAFSCRSGQAGRRSANRIQRLCFWPSAYRLRACHAVHKPACYFLLQARSTYGKRRRAECLWSSYMGAVFCIPGV